jgi:hypothetical protein
VGLGRGARRARDRGRRPRRPHFRRIRRALAEGDAAVLDTLLASSLPWAVFALETGGTLVIVWLMVYKPF